MRVLLKSKINTKLKLLIHGKKPEILKTGTFSSVWIKNFKSR